MQNCPNCGNQLSDKASSCARCGYRRTTTNDHAPQQNKPLALAAGKNVGGKNSPAFPARAQTPLLKSRNGEGNRSNIEAPKGVSVAPNGLPGNRGQVHNNGTFALQKGNQQIGSSAMRTRVISAVPPRKPSKIGEPLWRLVSPVFTRAGDAEPERPNRLQPQPSLLGWLPVIAVSCTLGLFTTTTAFNAARNNSPQAELYYWLGIGLIFLPPLIRLLFPQASRTERVGLLCTMAICLFLTKVALSPLYYSGYDEFLHWRTINDIVSTGHLFSKNTLLPVSPYFPGLEIVASAFSNLSGVSTIQAGYTIVGVACLLTVLCLFLLGELLSGSARIASIAAAIFMTNPHFLFFDTQFAYETLAIPLATFVLFAMARYELLKNNRPWVMLAAWIVLTAMILTHHATNYVFEGLFLLWSIIYLFLRPQPLHKTIVIPTLFVGLAMTVLNVLLIGPTLIGYFSSIFADVGKQITQTLSGVSGPRTLFAGTVIVIPLWERLLLLSSVGLITLSIPFLLICFWRRYRHNSLVWVFAIIIVFYPILQILRSTSSGVEVSDRASAFIFIAFSFLAAVAIVQFWPVRSLNWKQPAIISAFILVLFMGGIILGEGIPPSFMPGPYRASAGPRSIDAESIQAGIWTRTYLGPNNRMYTDRVNQLVMNVYGDQYLVTQIGDKVDVTEAIFDKNLSTFDIAKLQAGRVHYLVIDMRMSQQLPQDGFYFEHGEPSTGPNSDTIPMNSASLTKFDTVPQINRLFDSGNIAIYDTGGLINAPQIP